MTIWRSNIWVEVIYVKFGWMLSRSIGGNVSVPFWWPLKDFLGDLGLPKRSAWGQVTRWSSLWQQGHGCGWDRTGKGVEWQNEGHWESVMAATGSHAQQNRQQSCKGHRETPGTKTIAFQIKKSVSVLTLNQETQLEIIEMTNTSEIYSLRNYQVDSFHFRTTSVWKTYKLKAEQCLMYELFRHDSNKKRENYTDKMLNLHPLFGTFIWNGGIANQI